MSGDEEAGDCRNQETTPCTALFSNVYIESLLTVTDRREGRMVATYFM